MTTTTSATASYQGEKIDSEQQQHIEQQLDPPSSSDNTNLSNANDNKELTDNQQVQEINTNVNLIDFLRCYVRLERCKIENYGISHSEAAASALQNYVVSTQDEEDEKENKTPEESTMSVSRLQGKDQSNQCLIPESESNDEEWCGERLDFEDFNMLENYIYIDLSWPESSQ